MSTDSMNKPTGNEEVDLKTLFDVIGRLFEKISNFFVWIFKSLLSIIVNISRAVIDNFKIIVATLIIAAGLGYALEKIDSPVFESTMLVKTYFDAKFQLHNNIEYFNALLEEQNYDALKEIFNVNKEEIESIQEFNIAPGPETENERIILYDAFVKGLDSIRAQEITYEEYIDNRGKYGGTVFEIQVLSTDRMIFSKLEDGIFQTFNNAYSNKKKKKRDSLIQINKESILASLEEIDSLTKVYINVLEEESQATKARINITEGFPLQQERSSTKEYQLLNREIELRDKLRQLDIEQIEESEFFDVIANFQPVGNKVYDWKKRYSIILPLLALVGLILIYLTKNYVRFVRSYEG